MGLLNKAATVGILTGTRLSLSVIVMQSLHPVCLAYLSPLYAGLGGYDLPRSGERYVSALF